jgi:hypothetical protein
MVRIFLPHDRHKFPNVANKSVDQFNILAFANLTNKNISKFLKLDNVIALKSEFQTSNN